MIGNFPKRGQRPLIYFYLFFISSATIYSEILQNKNQKNENRYDIYNIFLPCKLERMINDILNRKNEMWVCLEMLK